MTEVGMRLMAGVTRCLFLFVVWLVLPAIAASQPTECHTYDAQQPVREGWGAAYDVFSAEHEVLLKATCTPNETQITVGNNNTDIYIYHLAHFWINEQEEGDKELQCNGEKVDNRWCVGEATGVIASPIKYFAAYTCRVIDGSWKCGCRDTLCAESLWQLQAVGSSEPSGQPPVITLLGDNPLNQIQGCPFIDPGATAIDTEDGDLTYSIIVTGSVDIQAPGQYFLTYAVTDSEGLSDSETRQVVVFGVIGTPTCQPEPSTIYGESFGTVTDEQGLHNYVSFRINPPRIGNWRVECPWKVPSCSVWPQDSPHYVLAGFQWPDNVDPYLFMVPSDFRLYPQ